MYSRIEADISEQSLKDMMIQLITSTISCKNNQAREDQSAVRNIPEGKAFRIRITIDKTIVEAKYTAIF